MKGEARRGQVRVCIAHPGQDLRALAAVCSLATRSTESPTANLQEQHVVPMMQRGPLQMQKCGPPTILGAGLTFATPFVRNIAFFQLKTFHLTPPPPRSEGQERLALKHGWEVRPGSNFWFGTVQGIN